MLAQARHLANEVFRLGWHLVIIQSIACFQSFAIFRCVHCQHQISMLAQAHRERPCCINMLLSTFGYRIILIGGHSLTSCTSGIGYIHQGQLVLQAFGSACEQNKAQLVRPGEEANALLGQLANQNFHAACFAMRLRKRRCIIATNQKIIKIAAFHTVQKQLCGHDIMSATRV